MVSLLQIPVPDCLKGPRREPQKEEIACHHPEVREHVENANCKIRLNQTKGKPQFISATQRAQSLSPKKHTNMTKLLTCAQTSLPSLPCHLYSLDKAGLKAQPLSHVAWVIKNQQGMGTSRKSEEFQVPCHLISDFQLEVQSSGAFCLIQVLSCTWQFLPTWATATCNAMPRSPGGPHEQKWNTFNALNSRAKEEDTASRYK